MMNDWNDDVELSEDEKQMLDALLDELGLLPLHELAARSLAEQQEDN